MFKGISAIVIGVGLLIAAAISAQSTREFLRTSIVVPGLVVKLNAGGYHPGSRFRIHRVGLSRKLSWANESKCDTRPMILTAAQR
jgi:hypothetical protein